MPPEFPGSPAEGPTGERILAAGQRVGRYHLLRRLAVGGMAEIFLARSEGPEGFEKLVVLKSILSQRAADEEWVRMFLEEARLAATLQHPNVAQVFDFGHEGDIHFFTMEYVRGADLRRIMTRAQERTGIPLEVALAVVAGAAAGLHHAHEKTDEEGRPLGIVHRDVSPSNVLVGNEGAVKVVDFGIAKAAVRRAATRTGTIKGKAGWISPEQARGEPLDRRSDIFSIGILLYEMTCGVQPFRGESEYAILRQVVEEDALPPSRLRPDYPPALEAIVMRCLRRDPEQRYATAQELQVDLETFAREQGLTLSSVEIARFMEELFGPGGVPEEMATATRVGLLRMPAWRGRGGRPWLWATGLLAAVGFVAGGLWARGTNPAVAPTLPAAAPSPPPLAPAPAPPPPSPPASAPVAAVEPGAVPRKPAGALKRKRARLAAKTRPARAPARPAESDLDAPFPR